MLVFLGVAVAAATGGTEAAEAFVCGGAVAFIYQVLLNRSVDSLPLGGAEGSGSQMTFPDVLGEQVLATDGSSNGPLSHVGGSSLQRLVLTGALMLTAILTTQLWDGVSQRQVSIGVPCARMNGTEARLKGQPANYCTT
jgi:hypothetical protein